MKKIRRTFEEATGRNRIDKRGFFGAIFRDGAQGISELNPNYDNRVRLLTELVAVYDTISEAERDIAYLEAEAKKEAEASK